jgi:hypothetical protein
MSQGIPCPNSLLGIEDEHPLKKINGYCALESHLAYSAEERTRRVGVFKFVGQWLPVSFWQGLDKSESLDPELLSNG